MTLPTTVEQTISIAADAKAPPPPFIFAFPPHPCYYNPV